MADPLLLATARAVRTLLAIQAREHRGSFLGREAQALLAVLDAELAPYQGQPAAEPENTAAVAPRRARPAR